MGENSFTKTTTKQETVRKNLHGRNEVDKGENI